MAQSQSLTNFYNAYAEWLEANAPEHPVFDRGSGLCLQLLRYCIDFGVDVDARHAHMDEFTEQLTQAGLCDRYPFDIDDQSYLSSSRRMTCHLNPNRIAWVREHVGESA